MKIKLTTIISRIAIILLIAIPIKSLFVILSDEWIANKNPLPVIGLVIPLVCLLGYIIFNWDDWDDYYIDFGVITRFINKIFKS